MPKSGSYYGQFIFQLFGLLFNITFYFSISYLEIYNEKVNDLLAPSVPVVIKQIANIPVIKAHEEMVTDSRNVMEFVRKGNKNRQIGETKENKQSSRSHALFRIVSSYMNTSKKSYNFFLILQKDCTNGINVSCKFAFITINAQVCKLFVWD